VAQFYERHLFVEEDHRKNLNQKALFWYKQSAKQGCIKAQYRLGQCYQYQQLGEKENISLALSWYQAAVDQGYTKGHRRINKLKNKRITFYVDKTL
jgi:TPR repeat protein